MSVCVCMCVGRDFLAFAEFSLPYHLLIMNRSRETRRVIYLERNREIEKKNGKRHREERER